MREVEEREAAGESLWTDQIPRPALVKIGHYWESLTPSHAIAQRVESHMSSTFARNGHRVSALHPEDFEDLTDTDVILNHIEALGAALIHVGLRASHYHQMVNTVFNEHRVAFRLVEGEVVPLSSDELHVEVIEPTLRLLIDSRFADAHAAYMKALKEISGNDPADAITDAGTALQSTLTALGVGGNSIGAQLKEAKKTGLLAKHDQALADGIGKFIDWASADRSETGDAHKHSDATLSDAWLMVHIVGALILRLADATPRGHSGEESDPA